jgi:hypothetical protein
MPIKINLYHDELRAKLAERRSPKRLLIALGVIAAGGLVVLGSMAGSEEGAAKASLAAKNAELKKLEKQAKDAKADEERLVLGVTRGEALAKALGDRIYAAPLLEKVIECIPQTAQLTRLTTVTTPTSPRRANVSLEGVMVGENGRKAADDMRVALATRLGSEYHGAEAQFRALVDTTEPVMVRGEKQNGVNFAIELSVKVEAEPPPPPAPSTRVARTKASS